MKKFWAIACVIAFTAFWTFGFIALSGAFGDRPFDWASAVFCVFGLGIGIYARLRVNALTREMKKGLHVRPSEPVDATWEEARG